MKTDKIENFDAYLKSLPNKDQTGFLALHQLIQKAAPGTAMGMGYGMPCIKLEGIVLYYASFKNHYSIFPGAAVIAAFKTQLVNYQTSKGTIQFDHSLPLPKKLIKEIVAYSLAEKMAKNDLKKLKKRS